MSPAFRLPAFLLLAWIGAPASASPAPEPPPEAEDLYLGASQALTRRDYPEAIRLLERLTALDDYPVYRADLGRAYLGAQQYERARAQFLLALEGQPPPEARDLLHFYLRMAEQRQTQAREWFARLELGWRHDSNVNLGPSRREATLYGLPFTWSDASLPRADQGLRLAASVVHARPLGHGWQWQSNGQLELLRQQNETDRNTDFFSLDSGPHIPILEGRGDLHLVAGVSRSWQGDAGQSRSCWFSPQASLPLAAGHQARARLLTRRAWFDAAAPMNADLGALTLAWRWEPAQDWTLEAALKTARESAADPAWSHRDRGATLELSGALPARLRLEAEIGLTRARYKAAESWADAPREERRRHVQLDLSRELGGGWYAALSWESARVEANLGPYDTRREIWQAQVSRAF